MRIALNQSATAIFNRLLALLDDEGYTKIENSNGTFMPLSVEKIQETQHGSIYSLMHSGVQNGDLMRDPDMTFLAHKEHGIMPMSYQQDYLGIYTEAVFFNEECELKFYPKATNDLVKFAHMWLNNIKDQQGI